MLRSPGMKGRQATALGLVALLWTATASAQNPREVLLGGRTATMGGTGTATGNDSAMPYLNPAGLAGLPGDVLAVSASLYAHTSRSYDAGFFNPKGFAPAFGDVSVREESVTSSDIVEMPSSVMYVRHLGGDDVHHVLGMSLVIPQASRSTVQATFEADAPGIGGTIRQTRAYSKASTRYYLGPSYAIGIGPDLRLGLSGHMVHVRGQSTEQETNYAGALGGAVPVTSKYQKSSESSATVFVPTVGVQGRLVGQLHAGVAVAAPSIRIAGNSSGTSDISGTTADVATSQPLSYENALWYEGSYEVRVPMRINAGLAWQQPDSFTVAADVHYYAPRSRASVTDALVHLSSSRTMETARQLELRQTDAEDDLSVVDVSLGLEVSASSTVALRAGGFTDFATSPSIKETANLAQQYDTRIDRYGGTLGLGLALGSFDTTFGLFYVHGKGHVGVPDAVSEQAIAGNAMVAPVGMTTHTFGVILSSAVTIEEAKQTMRDTLGGAQ